MMCQKTCQSEDEKKPYGIRLKRSLFDSSCVRLCVKMPGFRGRKSKENTFSVNLGKKELTKHFYLVSLWLKRSIVIQGTIRRIGRCMHPNSLTT